MATPGHRCNTETSEPIPPDPQARTPPTVPNLSLGTDALSERTTPFNTGLRGRGSPLGQESQDSAGPEAGRGDTGLGASPGTRGLFVCFALLCGGEFQLKFPGACSRMCGTPPRTHLAARLTPPPATALEASKTLPCLSPSSSNAERKRREKPPGAGGPASGRAAS